MGFSDLKFFNLFDLESVRQAEKFNKNTNVTVEKLLEALRPLENLDLSLNLSYVTDSNLLQKDDIMGFMTFQPELFDRSTVVMIFECFKNLLEMAVENPHKVVWDLPMLPQAEQQRQ